MNLQEVFQKYTGAECGETTFQELGQDLDALGMTMRVHRPGPQFDVLINNDIDVYVGKAGGKEYISRLEIKRSGPTLD